jgi:diacylglycerol kinase (ATP)
MPLKIKKVAVIINPASGKKIPILYIMNKFFIKHNIRYDVYVTGTTDSVIKKKYDCIVGYGGDGTFLEIGRKYKEMPILLLHGGTANTLQKELNIPPDPKEALRLLLKPKIKRIDSILVNHKKCFGKLQTGKHIKYWGKVKRDTKDLIGNLAYIISAAKSINENKKTKFLIKTDGQKENISAEIIIISNTGNFGLKGIKLSKQISPFDGYLDILVLKQKKISSLITAFFNMILNKKPKPFIHKRIKDIEIKTKSKLLWYLDDEIYKSDNVRVKVIPKDIKMIVP